MSAVAATPLPPSGYYPIPVDRYLKMIEAGILTGDDRVELLNGFLVRKMPHGPQHDTAVALAGEALRLLLLAVWTIRIQSSIRLAASMPEPDVCVARGSIRDYSATQPRPHQIGLLVEVADSSLAGDRGDKSASYGREGIPIYWIVNLVDRQVEVMIGPSGPCPAPGYAHQEVFLPGQRVPVMLDGTLVGTIAVDDLLP